MRKFEITREQINELYNDISISNNSYRLKEWFPQAFASELETGKWYTPLNQYGGIALVCVQNPNDTGNFGYGFDWLGNWKDNGYTVSNAHNSRLATDKEVETALIAEAKRRGFKEGVKFNVDWETYGKGKGIIQNSIFKLNNNSYGFQTLCQIGQPWIFCNGKWAEIIYEPIELTLEQRIERIEEQLKIKK